MSKRTITEDQAAYQWLTTADLMREMQTSRDKVIGIIRTAPEFKGDNVIRWGREYRIRPEAWEAYKGAHTVGEQDAA